MPHKDHSNHQKNKTGNTSSEDIACLNDHLRKLHLGGQVVATPGIIGLGADAVSAILARIRSFEAFTPDNDPYGERDFGSIKWAGHTIFWKIDAYDRTLCSGSPDPTDPSVTRRVMTIMLAEEY